jgi:tetratricopeptide (TPR) repeat protein
VDQLDGETKKVLTRLSVFTTLDLSFKQLSADLEPGKLNFHVLNLCAYLHNEDISENLFRAHFESKSPGMDWMKPMFPHDVWDRVSFEEMGTEKLKQLFFVNTARHEIEHTTFSDAPIVTPHLSLHPLVRDWLQEIADSDIRQEYLKETIEMLDKFITSDFVRNASPSEIRKTLAHLDVCIQSDARYLNGHGLGFESLIHSGIRFANFYRDRGQYVEAEDLYIQAIVGGSGRYKPDYEQVIVPREALGIIYRLQGRLKEAEEILSEVLRISDRKLGPDNIESLVTASHLAIVYKNTGRYEQAREILERIRATLERSRDSADKAVMKRKLENAQVLGSVYRYLGRPLTAEPLLLEAFEGYRNLGGPRDRETLGAATGLAAFYADQGRIHEAEEIYSQTFQGHEVFGENHPQTIQVLIGKAAVCLGLFQLEKAQKQYQNALDRDAESSLAPNHPIRTKILEGLGLCHFMKGGFDEAENLYKQVIENYRELLGPDDHNTVGAVNQLHTIVQTRQTLDQIFSGVDLPVTGEVNEETFQDIGTRIEAAGRELLRQNGIIVPE